MKNFFVLVLLLMLLLSVAIVAQAASLTGKWRCNDGGTYYLHQIDDRVYWYGENSATAPGFSNIGVGKIVGNYIYIEATDVPKGNAMAQSDLILYKTSDTYFYAVTKTGPFGALIGLS